MFSSLKWTLIHLAFQDIVKMKWKCIRSFSGFLTGPILPPCPIGCTQQCLKTSEVLPSRRILPSSESRAKGTSQHPTCTDRFPQQNVSLHKVDTSEHNICLTHCHHSVCGDGALVGSETNNLKEVQLSRSIKAFEEGAFSSLKKVSFSFRALPSSDQKKLSNWHENLLYFHPSSRHPQPQSFYPYPSLNSASIIRPGNFPLYIHQKGLQIQLICIKIPLLFQINNLHWSA